MAEWLKILLGTLATVFGGLILAAITAGFAKVWHLGTSVARVEQKLDDHISSEGTWRGMMDQRYQLIEQKLPNGELKVILERLENLDKKLGSM